MNKNRLERMSMVEFHNADESKTTDEVFSKVVKAGKRTYFFDVRETRNNDYYLTITESRKKQNKEGVAVFDKHKIYLYKEDFCKFHEGLEEVVQFVKSCKPECFNDDGSTVAHHSLSSIDEEFEQL